MSTTALLPIIAFAATLAYLVHSLSATAAPGRRAWVAPALLFAAFLGFSLATVAQEGVLKVWENHSTSFWGNQVWFDLLLSVALAWTLLLPRARAAGMRPLPWMLFVGATASVGLLAMTARVLWLEGRARGQQDGRG